MRIAVVTTSYPAFQGDPSGHFVAAEVEAMQANGEEVSVFAPRGAAFGWPGVRARLAHRPWLALAAQRELVRLRREIICSGPFDRVDAHWALPSALIVPRRVSALLTIISHGGDVRLLLALPSRLRERAVSLLLGRAFRWRFVSEALLNQLARGLTKDQQQRLRKLAFVSPSPLVMPDVQGRARELREAMGGRRLAVVVGRLVPSKRFERAIQYIAIQRDAFTLVIVGDGPERQRLTTVARRVGIDVRFVGRVERGESLAWIAAADELVHSSACEGASTVLREARALKTCVVDLTRNED